MHFFGETETREMKIKEGKKREDVRGGKGNLGKRGENSEEEKGAFLSRYESERRTTGERARVEPSGN